MSGKLYLIAIGIPSDSGYHIAGYTRTKGEAKKILRKMGYPHLHKLWGYYYNKKLIWSGKWAKIFVTEELTRK